MVRVHSKRRGVFFLSVLFLSLVLAMFVAASLESGLWGLKRGQNQSDVAAARRAASSGVEYALARLKDNPAWTANTPNTVTVNVDGFFVVEEYGNVIGIINDNGRASQFRIRFNYADGAGGDDGMPNAGAAMSIASPWVSLNNMVAKGQADVPLADGPGASVPTTTPTIYTSVPGHSVFLVVEGRCGDWLAGATTASPNPTPPAIGAVTSTQVESVFKVANTLDGGTPAVASAAGNFEATLATTNKKDSLSLDSATGTQVGRLRTRGDLDVTGGQSGEYNLTAGKGGGEFRALGTANHNADPTVVQQTETAADTLYPIPWSDVHKADGSNALPAGTYVFWDDGSLHYFDMTVSQYYNFMANPLNHSNPGLPVSLPSSVVPSSTGSGSGLKAKLTVTADTLVQAATNTTDLAILPKKGAAGGPGSGGSAPEPSDIASQVILGNPQIVVGVNNFPNSSQILMPEVAAYSLINRVAMWSADLGQGTYAAGNWALPSGGTVNNLGTAGAIGNVDESNLAFLAQQISSYIASHPNDPDWPAFAMDMSLPTSTDLDEISTVSSDVRPSNIEIKFDPASGQDSATLTGPGNVTLGAKISGEGASITAEGNLSLIGLGVNLSALTNPTEGVSLYSKKDVSISTFDKGASAYRDVALKGVVYAWGNFRAILGSTTVSESDWGKLKLTGAMIAYGKDPSDLAASATQGNVKILAKEAKLKYDSAYMLDFTATLPANIVFNRVRWLEK